MEIVEPKCPKCKKSNFAYKRIPLVDAIISTKKRIKEINKRIDSNESEREKKREMQRLQDTEYTLNKIVNNPTDNVGEAMIIYCMSCGEIIGTGGGVYKVFGGG